MSMFHPATVRPLLTLGAGQGHTCQPHGEASPWAPFLMGAGAALHLEPNNYPM